MPLISKYTIKAVVLPALLCITASGVSFQAQAQFRSDEKYGFRIGFDLSRIPVHYLNPYRTDLEIHTDLRVDSDWYAAFDAGWNKTRLDNKPAFEYNSNGYFIRLGADYNLIKRQFPAEANMLYVGFRYGIARMRRSIPQYQITDPYWGNASGSFPAKTLLPQWGELILGMKAEVLNNLFLGWSLHTRILITQNVDKQVRPYLIPGFGKATKNAVFDVNYSISYRIPLWSPKPRPEKAKKKAEKNKPEPDKKTEEQQAGHESPKKR